MPDASRTTEPSRLVKAPPTGGGVRATLAERVWAGIVAVGSLAVLSLAAHLTPSDAGVGTHTQIGLPACGFKLAWGTPCPTCGMTTAFSHAADARYLTAAETQPMGTLLALVTAMAFWLAGHIALTGSTLGRQIGVKIGPLSTLLVAGLLAGWAYTLARHGSFG